MTALMSAGAISGSVIAPCRGIERLQRTGNLMTPVKRLQRPPKIAAGDQAIFGTEAIV
jgi:hypothetical protein